MSSTAEQTDPWDTLRQAERIRAGAVGIRACADDLPLLMEYGYAWGLLEADILAAGTELDVAAAARTWLAAINLRRAAYML